MLNRDKSTDDLLTELKNKEMDLQTYIDSNPNSFIECNLAKYWSDVVKRSHMKKIDIINSADCGYTFFYNIINGHKIPSKDTIVRLMLAMHMPLEECQTALVYCGHSMLYPRIKEDSVYIYALEHNLSVMDMRIKLNELGEEQLHD